VLPAARISQHASRKPPAANVERVTVRSPTRPQIAVRRSERQTKRQSDEPPACHEDADAADTEELDDDQRRAEDGSRGDERAVASGSIATASTRPSEMIESAMASRPSLIPPSLRSVEILNEVVESEGKDSAAGCRRAAGRETPAAVGPCADREEPLPPERTEHEARKVGHARSGDKIELSALEAANSSASTAARRARARRAREC